MIISASRRTDIPAFYSRWFMNRIGAGMVMARNPFNPAQVQVISLKPRDVDGFVFWSKNPAPMLPALDVLDAMGCPYYFQFTLTPYGPDLETGLGDKGPVVETFRRLSRRLGPNRVIWRYDPIILNAQWDIPRHIQCFSSMCAALSGYTEQVVVSFVDMYKKVRSPAIGPVGEADMHQLAAALAPIARAHGLGIAACCEAADFTPYGIGPSACVDRSLLEVIGGRAIASPPHRGQRAHCGCSHSVDIGAYNTCGHGCVYCYANHSPKSTQRRMARHDPAGVILIE